MTHASSFAILFALGLTACATGYSPSGSDTYKSGASTYVTKLASNSEASDSVSIPPQIIQASMIKSEPELRTLSNDVNKRADAVSNVKPTDQREKPGTPARKQTYKRLEYGAHKPLICKDPVLAKGKLKGRPNLQVMWENYLYPRPEGIWSEIGGYVEINGNLPEGQGRWTNACAVRLSHMLLKAGHRIPQRFGITSSAANKDQYIYRLSDMEDYLTEILGEPDYVMKGESTQWYNLPNVPGIVVIDFPGHNSFTGHSTVWNGAGTVDGSDTVGDKLLFWELPCFIPKDREEQPEILVGQTREADVSALP